MTKLMRIRRNLQQNCSTKASEVENCNSLLASHIRSECCLLSLLCPVLYSYPASLNSLSLITVTRRHLFNFVNREISDRKSVKRNAKKYTILHMQETHNSPLATKLDYFCVILSVSNYYLSNNKQFGATLVLIQLILWFRQSCLSCMF